MTEEQENTQPVEPAEVYDPGALTEGALTPAVEALSLKDRLRASGETQKVSAEIQGIKRGPGRPRGSKNRPKDEPEKGYTPPDTAELERQRKLKKQRADAIAGQITGELNDILFELLIGQGLPAAALYNSGHIPTAVKEDAKYTPLGKRLAVDSFTANRIGAFIVEMEQSELGSKMASKATGGPVGLTVKGLVAGACVFSYINGVRNVMKEYGPYIDAYKQYQQQQSQQNRGQTGGNSGLS